MMPGAAPQVSIWILSYNYARYMREAIESVLAQTLQDFELIIVDDGSTDDSLAIAQEYAARHPGRVRVDRHPGGANRGVSATANLATRSARGKYWCGLPADDVLPPDSLAVRAAYLDAHPEADFVYGHVFTFDDADPSRGSVSGRDVTMLPNPCEAFIMGNPVPGMSVMARRRCWTETGDHDEGLDYSDWDFWFRMFARHCGAFIPAVLARQRFHGANYSLGHQLPKYRRYTDAVIRNLAATWAAAVPHLDLPRNRARLAMMLALHRFFDGDVVVATHQVHAALDEDPAAIADPAFIGPWLHFGVYYWTSETNEPAPDFLAWFEDTVGAHKPAVPGLRETVREISFGVVPQLLGHRAIRPAARRLLLAQARVNPGRVFEPAFAKAVVKYLLGPSATRAMAGVLRRHVP